MWLLKKIREWWLARRAEKWRCKMVEQYGVAGQFFFKDMPKQSQAFFDENFKILDSKVSDDGQYVEMIIETKNPIQKIEIEGVLKL